MRYPIAIESGDAKQAYEIVVPDLPRCFSAGETLDDALTNSREANLLQLDGLLNVGNPFPAPTSIEQLQKKLPIAAGSGLSSAWTSASLAARRRVSTLRCRNVFSVRSMLTPGNRARLDRGFSPVRHSMQCASPSESQWTRGPPIGRSVIHRPVSVAG